MRSMDMTLTLCVQRWNGTSFERTTLGHLGLTMQLNHLRTTCPLPIEVHEKFVILDIFSPQYMKVFFCGCDRELPPWKQLLHRRIYPATQDSIQTCATFRYLDYIHLHSLTAKGSTLGFYQTLERLADNAGLAPTSSRYPALKRMLYQWRHLMMLKRAGRAHDPDPKRVENTKPGKLTIKCPSCPQPGVNLPDGWEQASPEDE